MNKHYELHFKDRKISNIPEDINPLEVNVKIEVIRIASTTYWLNVYYESPELETDIILESYEANDITKSFCKDNESECGFPPGIYFQNKIPSLDDEILLVTSGDLDEYFDEIEEDLITIFKSKYKFIMTGIYETETDKM